MNVASHDIFATFNFVLTKGYGCAFPDGLTCLEKAEMYAFAFLGDGFLKF